MFSQVWCFSKAAAASATLFIAGAIAPFSWAQASSPAPQYNPNFHYFINGQVIGPRQFTLGDSANWNIPVTELSARSATGKVKAEPVDYQSSNDAIKVTWSKKKGTGQFALYGQPINLAAVKSQAALVMDVRVDRKPKGSVTIAMDCEWPCRGGINAQDILRSAPANEWLSLPIPLSCLKGEEFDLSKINGVLLISTDSYMTLSIANVRVERMPEDLQGCTQ